MLARFAGSVFAVCVLAVGCGSKESSETEAAQSMRCAPGAVYSCVRWNCNGHQRCADDGAMLGACMCDGNAADGGSAGSTAGGAGGAQSSLAKASSSKGGAAAKSVDAGDQPQDAGQTQGPSKPDKEDAGKPSVMDAGHMQEPAKQDAGKPTKPDMQMMPGMPQTMTPAKPELCDNGLDDDGDGKVDCADSDCSALSCVAAAPSGWLGPVGLHTATAAAFSCSGLFDQRAFEAGVEAQAAPAQCSACTCQGSCGTFVDFSVSAGTACSAASACTTSVNGGCVEIAPACLQMATVASLETKLPNAGSCTTSEQHATLASPSWKTQVSACGLPAAGSSAKGCEAEQLCLPKEPGTGLGAGYCVWREGEVDCPAATYTERSVYYREFQDTRTCSACGCAASSCKYTWRVFNADDAMCTSPVLELSSAGECAQVNAPMGKLRVGGAVSGAGSCTSSGGESRGGVAGSKPLTVCCAR